MFRIDPDAGGVPALAATVAGPALAGPGGERPARAAPPLARALTRLFRLSADVRPAELGTTVVMTLSVFLLLTAYYLLKTAREPLILLGGGAEVKSYASAGQALILLGVVPAYAAVARRVGRLRLLSVVYFFFVADLLVFAVLTRQEVRVGVPFYLWVGVFNYTAIAQFWGFAADIYSAEQGKRLFAVLGIGSSVGAVAGARIAKALVHRGPAVLMLGAAVILTACVFLYAWVDARAQRRPTREDPASPEPIGGPNAFQLLVRDRYLQLIAALTLVLNWVNSNGEYLLDRTLLAALRERGNGVDAAAFIGSFKADYFAWVNLAGVLLQVFAVSRILKVAGVRRALFLLPVVSFFSYGMMWLAPALALIRIGKVAENSLDYSLQNTARQALYLVTSRVEKYVGKTTVDTLFVRLGDVLSAAVVWLGSRLVASTGSFAALNLLLIVLWMGLVRAIGSEHRRRDQQAPDDAAVQVAP
jgi:AAA family ATP:ADP antiporter